VIVLLAVFADVVSPHDPLQQDLAKRLQPPFWVARGAWSTHWGRTILDATCSVASSRGHACRCSSGSSPASAAPSWA
jgi:ABC-type antimicrobial peptide transport system permease subunit